MKNVLIKRADEVQNEKVKIAEEYDMQKITI